MTDNRGGSTARQIASPEFNLTGRELPYTTNFSWLPTYNG
jgi:hypothetical protein